MTSIRLDINKIASRNLSVSVKLVGVRRFGLRINAAAAVLRLAGWISPVPIVVGIEDEGQSPPRV